MKSVIISGVVFILIIVLIIVGTVYTSSKAKQLKELVIQLSEEVGKSDWEKSERIFEDANRKWTKNEPILAMLFRHDEIDNIDVSMEKLGTYISLNDRSEALAEITLLGINVAHLSEKDKIVLANLF